MHGEAFSALPLIYVKTDSPKAIVLNPLWGVSSAREGWHLPQEKRVEVNTRSRQTMTQAGISPIHSTMGPFIVPPSHHSSLRSHIPQPLSLLRWYLSHLREWHIFSQVSPMYTWSIPVTLFFSRWTYFWYTVYTKNSGGQRENYVSSLTLWHG